MHAKNHVVTNDFTPSSPSVIGQVDELTIHWHVTDACNHRCRYCYAHWKDRLDLCDLFHGPHRTFDLLDLLFQCLHPESNKQLSLQIQRWGHAL